MLRELIACISALHVIRRVVAMMQCNMRTGETRFGSLVGDDIGAQADCLSAVEQVKALMGPR